MIAEKLEDERWYVQRNLLLLLERLRRVPQGFSTTPWTQHPDARVRYQGVSLQLAVPAEREFGDSRWRSGTATRGSFVSGWWPRRRTARAALIPQLTELARNAQLAEELRARGRRSWQVA